MQPAPTLSAEVAAIVAERDNVIGAYLFGSRVRGDHHGQSDVDVAVLGRQPLPAEELVELENALEKRLGLAVDLVDLSTAGAFLALDAVRGERVFERDPRALDEFDLFVLRRAADLAFFERERRAELLRPR